MPVTFPILMPDGTIHEQECLSVGELATMLHSSRDSVYRRVSAGSWPYLKVVRRVYFTPEHVRLILAMADHRPNGTGAQR